MGKETENHQEFNKTEEVERIRDKIENLPSCILLDGEISLDDRVDYILGDEDDDEEDYEYLTSQDIEGLKCVLHAGEVVIMLENGKSWNEVASTIKEWFKDKTPEERKACDRELCLDILYTTNDYFGTLFVDAIYGNDKIANDVREEYETRKNTQKSLLEKFGNGNNVITPWKIVPIILLARKAKNEGRINDIPEEIENLRATYAKNKKVLLTGRLLDCTWTKANPFLSQWYDNETVLFKEIENRHDVCLDVLGCAEPFFATLFADAIYGDSMPEDLKDAYNTRKEEERQILSGEQRKAFWITTLNVVPVISFAGALMKNLHIKAIPSEVESLKQLYIEKMKSYGDYIPEDSLFGRSDWINGVDISIGEIGKNKEKGDFWAIEDLCKLEIAGDIIKAIELVDEDERVIVDTLCARCDLRMRGNVAKIVDIYWGSSEYLEGLIYPNRSNDRVEPPKSRAKIDSHKNGKRTQE